MQAKKSRSRSGHVNKQKKGPVIPLIPQTIDFWISTQYSDQFSSIFLLSFLPSKNSEFIS